MKAVLGLIVLAGIGLGWWWLGRSTAPVAIDPVVAATDPLPEAVASAPAALPVVAWVAQAKARFEPCGCVAGMNGGLMRRAGLLARLPAARTLSLELGGWSAGRRAHERLRTGFYLRGLAAAGIDVLGVGGDEAVLGAAELSSQLASPGSPPAVCANLDAGAGMPPWKPWIVIEAAGERHLVTSVVPAGSAGDGLRIRDPAEALATAAIEAGRLGARLVCMADIEPDGCLALAAAVPQVALIIGGRSDHPSPEPRRIGTATVLWAGNHGKVAGWWAWGGTSAAFELIADRLPEHPAQRRLLTGYQQALADARFDMAPAGGLARLGGGGWTGSSACAGCHPAAGQAHAASRHHAALASLQRRGYQNDPDCLNCHVTGLGEGGYVRGAAAYAEVGCESCHGPGGAHAAAAGAGRPADAAMPPVSPSACTGCHDPDNSPRFAYPTYWPKILHGR